MATKPSPVMRWRDRGVVLLLTLLALGGLVMIPSFGRPYTAPAMWDGAPQFQVERAWSDMVTLAVHFPRRWSGTADRRASADWLAETLRTIGLEVHRETFEATLGDLGRVHLENVWGISRGVELPDELVVPLGNYDMAPTSYQAASDTAAHVGVVLELARLIHSTPHRRTFIFFFPDGEEWGMLGALQFARTYPQRRQIVASLSIEDLDAYDLHAISIVSIGQFRGFAPMWLRVLPAAAAQHEGLAVEEDPPLFEWLARSILVSATDQGPFLGAGIPSVDLAGHSTDREAQEAIYHKPGDTVDKMRPESLERYGRVMERVVRTIDAMPVVPREPDFYLRLGSDRTVAAPPLLLVQFAVFLPLLAAVVFRVRRATPWRDALRPAPYGAGLRGEARESGVVFGALLAWLAAVKVMPYLGLMPLWELYPATSRHPALTTVYWAPVILSFAVLAAVWWVLHRIVRGRRPEDPPPAPRSAATWRSRTQRISVALAGLLLVAAVTFVDNPFGAVTFLMLPALLWIWVEPARSWPARIGAVLAVLAGFLVIVALLVQYAAIQRIGPYILWYVFMGISYGQFTLLRVVLALAMTAIGLRLLQLTGTGNREPGTVQT
ncbi:MAG TPA: M28 family peptidase [bacterium]|nr:M28 family peptidase [bacterium]